MEAKGAVLLREGEWSADSLAAAICGLLGDPARLAAMRTAMLAAARPAAAGTIYELLAALG